MQNVCQPYTTYKKVWFIIFILLAPTIFGLFIWVSTIGFNMKDFVPNPWGGGTYIQSFGGLMLGIFSILLAIALSALFIWGAWRIKRKWSGKYKEGTKWGGTIGGAVGAGLSGIGSAISDGYSTGQGMLK